MFIEKAQRSYDRSGQHVARRARFLILVSLGLEEIEVTCAQCSGFGRYVANADDPDHARVVTCCYCKPIRCTACDGKGWAYDEHNPPAVTCAHCSGKGDLGGSGKATRYVHHKEIRALVRRVALHQCGHFMMGSARAFGHRIGLSGCYGGDGLTVTVPRAVFEKAIPIPQDLHDAWNAGGGHNSAGSEGPAMRDWALANLDKLEPKKGK